jgi:putative DNA methylase
MTADVAEVRSTASGLNRLSLKDAPSFIEVQFPVGRLSAEAYKERKAIIGQTLTALGSYWKGRKPLILVRAIVLGALLPATDDPTKDLDIFLKLMAMDDGAFGRRFDGSAAEFARLFPAWADLVTEEVGHRRKWLEDLDEGTREARVSEAFATLPYTFNERLAHVRRPEECDETKLSKSIWQEVNRHLGTITWSIPELVEQLGIARFGHRPKVADTFCGGGSIPFEAAHLGCDVYASDLNPIACMLTWGALNIIGADERTRTEIEEAQRKVIDAVDAKLTQLGVEHDEQGNRAKAYLYCVETRCTKTGWVVPVAPSWIISKMRKTVAKLVPDHANRRYHIEIHSGVSMAEMADAEEGTLQDGRLVHPMNPERSGVEIKTIRGDYKDANGVGRNRLRPWEKSDFIAHCDDIYQERLFCIQWIEKDTLDKGRQETFYATVTEYDLAQESKVRAIVSENLATWQDKGFVPDMPIEPGEKTNEPIRTRGWTYWHHLFGPRHLLIGALIGEQLRSQRNGTALAISFAKSLNYMSRLTQWMPRTPTPRSPADVVNHVFYNQALNTFFSYGGRAFYGLRTALSLKTKQITLGTDYNIDTITALNTVAHHDIGITDPPYADAVNYHEITEFFIAWLRNNPPPPFDKWVWDSQRNLAIRGKSEAFRRDMVAAYAAMTRHMPDNGLQVVMFTHQDAGVWADLGGILWASGLQIKAAWNVVTETEKPSGDGNYVQGTICLVLRKRLEETNARRMEIEAEIEEAVGEAWTAETLYTDGDLTLAAYAAALQVVTSYSTIDRQPLDRDLYRTLGKGERTMIRDLVDYAAQVANGLLIPEGFLRDAWRDLDPASRFYVRMLDLEAKGSPKVADFQNFAKSFAFAAYADLMASTAANAASLAGAADLKGRMLDGNGFATTLLRQVLFAIWKTMERGDPKTGVMVLRAEYASDYWARRQKLIGLAAYVAAKTARTRPEESAAAHELAEALKLDKV